MVLELARALRRVSVWLQCFHASHAPRLGEKTSAHYCSVQLDSKLDHFTQVLSEE